MEVLCTYVRENAPRIKEESAETTVASRPTADIQAIVTVLGRRSNREYEQGIQLLNLSNVNLHGAELIKTNLSRADLNMADLRAAKVTQEQLDEADGDSSTTLPEGLHMPESWKK